MNGIDILTFFMILIFTGIMELILTNEVFRNSENLGNLKGESKWKNPPKHQNLEKS